MESKKNIGLHILISVIVTFLACVIMFVVLSGKKEIQQVIPTVPSTVSDLQDQVFAVLGDVASSIVAVSISKDIKSYVDDPSRIIDPKTLQNNQVRLGGASGIIVRKDGYVLTNKHVVADLQSKYEVSLSDGSVYNVEKIRLDPVFDLAVLKLDVSKSTAELPVASFAPFVTRAQVGQFVLSIGNVMNLYPNSVSFGIVAGKNRALKIDEKHSYVGLYQTDAKISAGNSGGPLINLEGEIIGIMIAVDGQNAAFALPISQEFVTTLLSSIDAFSAIVRPLIGIEYVDITPALAGEKKLSVKEGILVSSALDGLPALQAGIKGGDVITAINEKLITADLPFLYHIYSYVPGTTISLTVIRGGQTLTIPVTLGQNVQ